MAQHKRSMEDLTQRLRAQGFEVTLANSGHWKVRNPHTGRKVQIARTPRQHRGVLNAVTRLKRIGFDPGV